MLVLTRKKNERIVIGNNVTVRILDTHGSRVKIGIEAPPHVLIRRAEIPPRPSHSQLALAVAGAGTLGR